ncbi:MAG: CBS domain-containing protein [Thermoguttaceae bacterium]
MPWLDWQEALTHNTLTLGIMLTVALAAGGLGGVLRLPKVTSYLLVGVLLGWLMSDHIPDDYAERIEPLTKLAIALVLFNLGCQFPMGRARRIMRRAMRLSLGELGATFLLVGLGSLLLGADWEVALLLAALAMATAPATTILVLKEAESEGPVTEYANALVAVNNFASIVAFELLFVAVLFLNGQLDQSPLIQLAHLTIDLAGSALVGILAGLLVSYCYGLVAEERRLVMLIGVVTVALGICLALDMPYLLAFLAMGITVANSSYQTRQIVGELDRLTGLLCVVFFVTHGAELKILELGNVGLVGIGYLVFRIAGKYGGIRLAMRGHHDEPQVQRWMGASLLAQAGAAIALSTIAVQRTAGMEGVLPELCLQIQTIILGTVVVFEIAGPLLIRQAVLRCGEVPLAHAIHHPGISPLEQLRTVTNRVLTAFGFDPWAGRLDTELTVNDIMRKNVGGVSQSATFNEVISRLEHSRDNTLPVVDAAGELVGVLRYREISHALFDRSLGSLVRAADLTTPAGRVLHPGEPLARASAMFAASKDDCIPVIAAEKPHQLLGVVRRRDVFRLLMRDRA